MLPLFFLLTACGPAASDTGASDTGATDGAAVDPAAPGPHAVGRATHRLDDGSRPLVVEVWYPTDVDAGSSSIADLVVDDADRLTFQGLLDAAPADCPGRVTTAAVDAQPLADVALPLVVLSHCHGCTRFNMLTVAEHLVSHGFAVVAPDHDGNTLFDELAGEGLPLSSDTLALRVADLDRSLEAALDGSLGIAVDAEAVAVMGHSFGSVTAGTLLVQRADRVRAGLFLGAPIDEPLLGEVDATTITSPTLFFLLAEDNSIGSLGNTLIRSNFEAVAGPSWLVELADGGHWSVSDLCGLTEAVMPGCGEDQRQEGGESFRYIDPARGRDLAAATAAAFFGMQLQGHAAGQDWLAAPPDAALATTLR